MHGQLRNVEDAAVETVLSKYCLGVAKMTHLLRIHGHSLFEEDTAIKEFDTLQERTLQNIFPGQDDASLRQTALGASVGGLGFRRAKIRRYQQQWLLD